MKQYRSLSTSEIAILADNRCSAESWQNISVCEGFDPFRLHEVSFYGKILLGQNDGQLSIDGLQRPCGIYQAVLKDCTIGDQVRISRIGSSISNYVLEDEVIIEDISLLKAEPGTAFGQGVKVDVLNEAGGRTVVLFTELNSQIAYLQALFRHDALFQNKLQQIITRHINRSGASQGVVHAGACIQQCGILVNIRVGRHARLRGVSKLENGTILSCPEHPTKIGTDVIAKNFIVAEGAQVEDGVMLDKVYVGQATRLGKQFSAENAVLFANCEGFHSEVCSIFAGPYTVTHHRSTLLIASLLSFFNAGSGTNQSNHMYKLGPLHQGIFERGSKTGSFSYTLLESHIPAFSVVIGKHLTSLDVPLFPFSYITKEQGASVLRPAINLFAIGTVRDGVKWPSRDRRQAVLQRDLIIFDVYSPYTVEKMRQGRDLLLKLYSETPREKENIQYGGVQISRLLLNKGAKYYGLGIDRYLVEKLLAQMQPLLAHAQDWQTVTNALRPHAESDQVNEWMDLSGLLARKDRVQRLLQAVSTQQISKVTELLEQLQTIRSVYPQDEWDYVCYAFQKEYNMAPHEMSVQDFKNALSRWENAANSLNALLLDNAGKEFAPFSQIGYGLGWGESEKMLDFKAVRGEMETHNVIQQLKKEKLELEHRAAFFHSALERFQL